MAGLFVYAGGATITGRDRYAAFCALAETLEETLQRRQPRLDTPDARYMADDLAEALLEDFFESAEDETTDAAGIFQGRAS